MMQMFRILKNLNREISDFFVVIPRPPSHAHTNSDTTSKHTIQHDMSTHPGFCIISGARRNPRRHFPAKTKRPSIVGVGLRKFHLPKGRTVFTKAAGFLFRIEDESHLAHMDTAYRDFHGLIVSEPKSWADDLDGIRSLDIEGKAVSILGMDSPDDLMPPTWVEVMQLREVFISCGARYVEYVHYEDDAFKIDM